MPASFLLYVAGICAEPEIVNSSKYPWNSHDDRMMERAKITCDRVYSPRNPCVGKFIKWGERDYRVICGPKTSEEK